jgi:hypothetical protein
MIYQVGSHTFTPGLYMKLKTGELFLFHHAVQNSRKGTGEPGSTKMVYVYSNIADGDFIYRHLPYSQLLAPSIALQLCDMCNPMDKALVRIVYDAFMQNTVFARNFAKPFAEWASMHRIPLSVSTSIAGILHFDTHPMFHGV